MSPELLGTLHRVAVPMVKPCDECEYEGAKAFLEGCCVD